MSDAVTVPAALSKKGIKCAEDNIQDGQLVNCGLAIFSHFEKEFEERFIEQPNKDSAND